MAKSCNILKYLVLTCLMVIVFPALSYSQIHTTRLEPAASLFLTEEGYQVAGIYWLPDYLKDNTSRDYNTNAGNNDNGGGDVEKTCETYGYASPEETDLSLYDCSDYDIKPMYGLQCYTGCVCKSKFTYTSSNCDTSAGYTLSGSSCGGKYESCVCSGECCSDSMCGSNQSCVNNVCEDNCAALPSGWQELPCADADLQTDTMDNECGGYYYKCSTAQAYCEEHGYSKDACDNGVVQDTCDKDSSYVKCQECNVMKTGWQETPCSDPDLQSGKEDNGCGGYYYQCMSTGEYCESKGFKKQECEAGEEATVCDKDSSYKTCACVPLSDESNCSWGTKNCDNACGGTRSCCKTAAEYCTENDYSSGVTCEKGQTTETCPADSNYKKCNINKPRVIFNWTCSNGAKNIIIQAKKNNGNVSRLGNMTGGTSGTVIYEDIIIGDILSEFSGYGIADDSPSGSESFTAALSIPVISITEGKDYNVNITFTPADRQPTQSMAYVEMGCYLPAGYECGVASGTPCALKAADGMTISNMWSSSGTSYGRGSVYTDQNMTINVNDTIRCDTGSYYNFKIKQITIDGKDVPVSTRSTYLSKDADGLSVFVYYERIN